jgi:peptidoglycan/LPS O-acetylase OafA/YrhL
VQYRSEVDGLRAVAVAPVVLFHGGFAAFSGGFVGVDVFFVISGYLITTIVLRDIAAGTFSIARFYERRIRRILPALFLVMAACIPPAWFLLAPNDMADFAESIAAVLACSSNILFWSESGYFDTAGELKPLLHTWSLAVEEQYYILFPPLLALLARFGHRAVQGTLALFATASLALAQWGACAQPDAAFFLLPTRAWELLVGALVAVHAARHGPPAVSSVGSTIAGFAGLAMIVAAVFGFDPSTPTPGFSTLLPTLGAALVIRFSHSAGGVGRLLSFGPVVGLGVISYSVYLWHQPLFAFAKHMSLDAPGAAVRAALSLTAVVLGYLSWRYVEQPFRDRTLVGRSTLLRCGAAAAAILLGFGLAGFASHGFPDRGRFSRPVIASYDFDNKSLADRARDLLRRASGDKAYGVFRNPGDNTRWFTDRAGVTRVLVVGNSHSMDLYNVFTIRPELFPSFEFARYGIQISDLAHPEGESLYRSPNYRAADVVMVSTRWSTFRFEAQSRGRSDFDGLEALMRRSRSDGKLLVLTSETPQFPQFGNLTLADHLVLKLGRLRSEGVQSGTAAADFVNRRYFEALGGSVRTQATNARLRDIAQRHGLVFLDKEDIICDKPQCSCFGIVDDGMKSYRDYGHFTLAGARFFGERAAALGWLDQVKLAVDGSRHREPDRSVAPETGSSERGRDAVSGRRALP